MRHIAYSSAFAIALLCVVSTGALAADTWYVMSRQGDCFPIRCLERKFSELGNISNPEAFVAFVQARGLNVSSRTISLKGGKAVEVLVPAKQLSLVFVTSDTCREKRD